MQRTIRLLFVGAVTLCGPGVFVGRAHSAAPAQAPTAVSASTAAPARAAASPPRAAKAEPVIATTGTVGDYLRAVHNRLHVRWTQDFVQTVSATYPGDHPLNIPSRQVTVAMIIRWDGSVAERMVKKSSGSPEFDRAAMDIARKGAPYPLPPADVISDDSYAHVEWTFARDHRACAAGAELVRVDDPLEVSLPRLIMSNRTGEALRRVGQSGSAGGPGGGTGLDRFARLFLGKQFPDPVHEAAASFALAENGDRAQVTRLRAALASRSTVDVAARGLNKLGVNVCEVVRESMEGGSATAREIAIAATRAIGGAGADVSACRPALAAIVADIKQPTALRLQALEAVVAFVPAAAARPVVMAATEDKDPVVRGAALLASVRKGAGRPEMYRLAPLLHDKTIEVRGAASAGMVRAGGDMALDQLYLLGRETDPRPGTWVAAELAQMSTRPSAEFLGKMLKKNNLAVQVAAARALSARKDAPARAELDAAQSDERLPREVRQIASASAGGNATAAVAVAASPAAGATATPAAASDSAAPVRQLLKSNRSADAAAWILSHFTSLETPAQIEVLGTWLQRPPAAAPTTGQSPSPSPPQTAAPASAPSAPTATALPR